MSFFRSLLLVCPAACLLAQTPTQTPARPAGDSPSVTGAKPAPPMSIAPPANAIIPPAPPDKNKVLITVGDLKLTYGDYDALVDSFPEQYRAQARGPGRQAFANQMVRMLVLAQEAKNRKLDQTPAYKNQLLFQQANVLAGLEYQQLAKDAAPSEADLKSYYESHKSEFEQVHARHILIRMQGSQVPLQPGQKDLTDAEALAKAQEIRKKIVAGEDFATLAKAESDDASSKVNGGDMPPFRKGQMVGPFEQAAFSMKPSDVSEPVKTPFGYHIIKLESKETKSFEEAKTEVDSKVKPQALQKSIEDLEKKANVVLDPEFFAVPNAPKQ